MITCCSLAVKRYKYGCCIFFYWEPTLNHNIMGPLRNIPPRQKNKHTQKIIPNSPTFNFTIMPLHHDILLKVSPISPSTVGKTNILDFLTDINPLETPVAQEPFWKQV